VFITVPGATGADAGAGVAREVSALAKSVMTLP